VRRWPLALVLGLAAAIGSSAAWAQATCPVPRNLPPLQIDVKVVEPNVTYHHDVDLFGLQKVGHVSERPPEGSIRLGVTQISDSIRYSFVTANLPLRDGRVCVWLTQVTASLGDSVMNVFVAGDYAPDTCEYKVILNHENTHVRFNIETLRDWMPTVRAELVEAAKKRFPVIFPGTPTDRQLSDQLLDNMHNVFALMNEDMAKRNATIDTPENYRREHAKCSNWSRGRYKLD